MKLQIMPSMGGANHNAELLTAAECHRRALAALANAGYSGLSTADVDYRLWRDQRFDARGAGLAGRRGPCKANPHRKLPKGQP